jgi:hypothetical protein
MPLTVIDCLSIIHDEWRVGDTDEGIVIVPADCFDKEHLPNLTPGTGGWKKRKGWGWRWYDSGSWCLTDNEWNGVYRTAQQAYEAAYDHWDGCDWGDDPECGNAAQDQWWKDYAELYNLKPIIPQTTYFVRIVNPKDESHYGQWKTIQPFPSLRSAKTNIRKMAVADRCTGLIEQGWVAIELGIYADDPQYDDKGNLIGINSVIKTVSLLTHKRTGALKWIDK